MELLSKNAAETEKTGENQRGTKKHSVDKLIPATSFNEIFYIATSWKSKGRMAVYLLINS